MLRTGFFQHLIILVVLLFSRSSQASTCVPQGSILQCLVTGSDAVNINRTNSNGANLLNIIYTGSTTLSLSASSMDTIIIKPAGESDNHTLQIALLNTIASRIEIQLRLSSNQILSPLFTGASSIIASPSNISILIEQTVGDAGGLKIFDDAVPPVMSLNNYEIIFDNSSSNSGNLMFAYLIRGLKNASRVFIAGNRHVLLGASSNQSSPININQLALSNFRLQDQILYNINNLNGYIIDSCEYSRLGQFLKSNRVNNVALIMRNNNPLDGTLPQGDAAFRDNLQYQSITLQEPKLNTSCLRAIGGGQQAPRTLVLNLGSYSYDDFAAWQANSPLVWYLSIFNIANLDVFPSKFFNSFDALHQLLLQGTFTLEKQHICVFAGINVLRDAAEPLISLQSPNNPSNWNQCADTYVNAINIRRTDDIWCPPGDTQEDCSRWCATTARCSLISQENQCPGVTITRVSPFYYNSSYLYNFFAKGLWLDRPSNQSATSPGSDSMNVGAIIGAVCGLLAAISIFAITIFCIYQYRKKDSRKAADVSFPKYIPSSDDAAHLSIATSKTSQSSRYALEKTFFPPMQPNNEIAPPLYTAPSESARSTSPYVLPSAPRAPRDSVSTHATHVYETVDP